MSVQTLRWLNVAGLGVMLTMNVLANALPINGYTTGQLSDLYPNLLVPAGFAFSIWSVIYLGLIGFVSYTFFGGEPAKGQVRAIGPWFLLNTLANAGWILAWHHRLVVLSIGIMLFLLLSLAIIYRRLSYEKTPRATRAYWLAVLPFSLYFGWISAATTLNITAGLVDAGWRGGPLPEPVWTCILIVVLTFLGLILLLQRGDVVYMAVLLWAFFGIYAKPSTTPPVTSVLIVCGLMLILATIGRLVGLAGSGERTSPGAG